MTALAPNLALHGPASPDVEASDGAARAVVLGVVEMLEAGRLAPGQRLVEADLGMRFGVGRNTVREALQRLASEGLVDLQRNRGARVRELTLDEAVETLEVTELLTGLAARTAARATADGATTERLEAALGQLAASMASDDVRAFVRARRAFYGALIRLGGNRELQRILSTIHVHVLRAQFQVTDIQRRLHEDYQAIGRAVLAGAPARAERAARRHVRRIRTQLIAWHSPETTHG